MAQLSRMTIDDVLNLLMMINASVLDESSKKGLGLVINKDVTSSVLKLTPILSNIASDIIARSTPLDLANSLNPVNQARMDPQSRAQIVSKVSLSLKFSHIMEAK